MAEIKTKPNEVSAESYIDALENPVRREDARTILAMMARITGHRPQMWGPSIIGFGSYHYKYESGHEGTMCRLGFSPRKGQFVLYVLTGYMDEDENEHEADLLARLGKRKVGKSCLYVNKLADIDMNVLETLTTRAWNWMNRRYPD